jgi:transposase-like protein
MSKVQELYELAERAYVSENLSFEEVARRFDIAEKTVRNWADKGNWRDRKRKLFEQKTSLDEKLRTFVDKLMDTILEDWNNGRQVDPGRMYAFNQLLGKLEKVQKYEQKVKEAEDPAAGEQQADPEALADRVREVLGLKQK